MRHNIYVIAGEALTDPRTVQRYLDGCKIRPLARERIERAIRKLDERDGAESKGNPSNFTH